MNEDKTVIRECICGNPIKVIYSLRNRKKFCSTLCIDSNRTRRSGLTYIIKKDNPTSFKKGMTPHNKKENPGYYALHDWVGRWKNDSGKCEHCGSIQKLQWSNISGEYKRDLLDWQRLCCKCHKKYDSKFESSCILKKYPKMEWKCGK